MINKIKKEWIEIFVRLLFDAFFILLLLFGITFLGEALIPGIITNKIGWRYLMLALFVNLGLIFYFSEKIKLALSKNFWLNKKNIPFWGIFVVLIFVGSFWRGSWISFFIAILCAFLVWKFVGLLKEN